MILTPAIRNLIREGKVHQIDGSIYSSSADSLPSVFVLSVPAVFPEAPQPANADTAITVTSAIAANFLIFILSSSCSNE